MESTLLASGLGFPEGPAVMGDGRLVLCDGNTGELLAYADGRVSTYARTGGSPWGTVLGTDGAIYVTQGGNVPGSGDTSAVSGIQRVMPGGTVELLFSEVAGYELYGPNDLAFGPDGRLYFTESGSEQDFRFDVRSPGRLFAVGPSGAGEMLYELPGVYPNGIAFDPGQRLYWTESMAHRIRRLNATRRAGDVLPALRRARARRHGLRRRRPAVRRHDDLRRGHGDLAGRRGAHRDPSR